MVKTALVIREPNKTLAAEYKKKLLDTFPTAFGYAVPMNDVNVDTDMFVANDHVLSEQLDSVEETYKDMRVFYWFCSAEEGDINVESLQPFTLLTNGEEGAESRTLIVAMVEGEHAAHGAPEGEPEATAFTNDYRLFNDFLTDKVGEYLALPGGDDLAVLMTMLDRKPMRDALKEHMAPRGNLILIPATGKAISYAENPANQGTFSWGFTTNNLGYKEEEEKVVGTDIPAVKKGALSLKKPADNVEATAKPKAVDQNDPKVKYAAVLKNPNFSLTSKGELWYKPSGDWKNAKSQWNTHCTEPRPKIGTEDDAKAVYAGFPASQLRANSPLREFMNKATGQVVNHEENKPKKADDIPGPAEPPKELKPEMSITLLIPGNQKENYTNQKKAGRFTSASIDVLKKTVTDYPAASVQFGENFGDILYWSPEAYMRFTRDVGQHSAICLMHEMRLEILRLKGELKEGEYPAKAEAPLLKPAVAKAKPKLSLRA